MLNDRYERNRRVEGVGEEGQQKLARARVLVVGAGGLGSPVLYYLAAAGVGTLGVVDYDVVDETNLQRQILHYTADLKRLKVESAQEKLYAINPLIKVVTYAEKLTPERGRRWISGYDYVLECCDNYEAKFLINDLCVELGKPYTHAAVLAMKGEVMSVLPGHATYRDIFPEPPAEGSYQTASEAGVIGSVAGIVGTIQATEAIKYITGVGSLILDRLLLIDACTMQFISLKVSPKSSLFKHQSPKNVR